MDETTHAKLLNALTSYDQRQAKRPGYNRFALGHYCAALARVRRHCDDGHSLRDAILNCFTGRLADAMLKAVGEPLMTRDEVQGAINYLPEIDD